MMDDDDDDDGAHVEIIMDKTSDENMMRLPTIA